MCGWTKGPARHLLTWWWNEEVAAIIDVKTKFKEWHKAKASPEEESKLKEYIEAKRAAKKAVAKAQQKGTVCRKVKHQRGTESCI